MKYDSIIIVGPTASGKTSFSVELAKALKGEIINADSQQIYKDLNIGTAKITENEKQGIKHHLFDIINVGDEFSVSNFKHLAVSKINEIKANNKLPIIVGGTGFYVDALIYEMQFGNSEKNEELRLKYENLAKQNGNEFVHNKLKELDPDSANKLHPNDLKRVIRAIEIATLGNIKKSQQIKEKSNIITPLIIGLNCDRKVLYERINNRVDVMLKNGLFDEVVLLKSKGFYNKNTALPIGYSEWQDYFNGAKTKEEVIEKIKQDTRNYAKRQITWFKRLNCTWFDLTNMPFNEAIKKSMDLFCE